MPARDLLSRMRGLPPRVWVFWVLGAVALLAAARWTLALDPALVLLLLDPEFLAVLALAGIALYRDRVTAGVAVIRRAARRGIRPARVPRRIRPARVRRPSADGSGAWSRDDDLAE